MSTKSVALDDEFNQIQAVLNRQSENLPKRQRSDTNTTEASGNKNEAKPAVS